MPRKRSARTPYTGREHARLLYPLAGRACVRCPLPAAVHHHRDENPLNNAPENIELLCRACHASHHNPGPHTHCAKGHLLEGWGVYVRPNGKRCCRICLNERNRVWKRKRRTRQKLVKNSSPTGRSFSPTNKLVTDSPCMVATDVIE
jgi:hypothetical protein